MPKTYQNYLLASKFYVIITKTDWKIFFHMKYFGILYRTEHIWFKKKIHAMEH